MPRNMTGKNNTGFSLLELLLVVGIGLLIAAVGLPMMNTAIANVKLRSSMTTVSGFLQNSRMLAVQKNRTMTARHFNRSSAVFSRVLRQGSPGFQCHDHIRFTS
jgi:prepilin-type N-terminal cleavage/methylation domain-containing protein